MPWIRIIERGEVRQGWGLMTPRVKDKNLHFTLQKEYGAAMKILILGLILFIAPITQANAYVSVNPSSMEFGGVRVGTSSYQTFFLQNFGTQAVQVNGCFVSGAFQCQMSCFYLPPGGSCTGSVIFRPLSETYEFATVTINMTTDFASISVHGSGMH